MNIEDLQAYIKSKDHNPDKQHKYFYKLVEEIGELSYAMNHDMRMTDGEIKGTVEEELYDVLYYVLAIANIYSIDLRECALIKERINREKYGYACDLETFISNRKDMEG